MMPSARGWVLLLSLMCAALLEGLSFAQSFNGTIAGQVTDPSGAVVPGAVLTLKSTTTGAEMKFTVGRDGLFRFGNLQQDVYELRASATGFQVLVQRGITVHVNQTVTANLTLAIGLETQSIDVNANASPLNFENAEIKQAVPSQAVEDLPLQVAGSPRAAASFAILLPGVTTGGGGSPFDARINGGQQLSDEALLDGVSTQQGVSSVAGMVSIFGDQPIAPEEVSEVSVLTSNYEPQYGSTSSSVITMVTKSGSNQFHGEGHEFLRNTVLNARPYGVPDRPQDIENEFGGSISGPVKLPWVSSGNRKTFFFFTYDRWVQRGATRRPILSFPTMQERNGDFRDWVDGEGNLVPIYDPATTQPNSAYDPNLPFSTTNQPFLRDQFMGCDGRTPNVICPTDPRLQNSLAQAWFKFLPPPNLPGITNNYFAPAISGDLNGSALDHRTTWALRVDHYLGDKDHFAATLHYHLVVHSPSSAYPPELATARLPADGGSQGPWINRLNWDHNFSPTVVNSFNFGYSNERGSEFCVDRPYANQFPQIPGEQFYVDPPVLNFENFDTLGCGGGLDKSVRPAYILNNLLTKVWGKHTLKFGGEYRALQQSDTGSDDAYQTYNFSRLNTGLLGVESGSAIASFLLEQVDGAAILYQSNTTKQSRQKYYSFHLGDTWKVTPKFTINYGLRWDLSPPAFEKFDRLSFLDPLGPNPGAGNRPGRLVFAGTGKGDASFGRSVPEDTFYKAFAPRLGLAYAWNDKTVFRGGYGIFFTQAQYPGWTGGNAQDGFNLMATASSSDSGLTPAFILSQGIPQNFTNPPFFDTTYLNGQGGPLYRPFEANRLPYAQQWNLTVEHQFTNNFYISTAYVGNKGTRLTSANAPINALEPKYLSVGQQLFDQFEPGQTQLDGVPVPYDGWVEQLSSCAPTVAQALMPYPQYCGNLQAVNENAGNSTYHSFQFKAEKRVANGTWLLGSYTISKLITDSESIHSPVMGGSGPVGAISPFERHRNKSLSTDDVPQALSISFMYELPFGKGKRFLNTEGAVNKILGGWQLTNIFRVSSGVPFFFRSSVCNVPSQVAPACIPAVLPGQNPFLQDPGSFDPDKGPLFNKAAFESPDSFNFYLGQGPRVSNLRGQGFHNQDITLMKNTRITEQVGIQFRAEFFNLWNWHIFNCSFGCFGGSAIINDVAAPDFGMWNGTITPPRSIQFGMKVLF